MDANARRREKRALKKKRIALVDPIVRYLELFIRESQESSEPENNLFAAVLVQALEDIIYGEYSRIRESQRYLYSSGYSELCQLATINPEYIRQEIHRCFEIIPELLYEYRDKRKDLQVLQRE